MLTPLQIKQKNMKHLKTMVDIKYIKKLNNVILKNWFQVFKYDLHHGQVSNEDQYIEKMSQRDIIKGLQGKFTSIFWITKSL